MHANTDRIIRQYSQPGECHYLLLLRLASELAELQEIVLQIAIAKDLAQAQEFAQMWIAIQKEQTP